MNEKFLDNDTSKFSMDGSKKSSKAPVVLWLTFGISLIATIMLLMLSKSVENSVKEKQLTRDELISQLQSPSYSQIETKANTFKTAFDIFSQISNSQITKKDLLAELYKYTTKDVAIQNLLISSDGVLQLDGATSTYRNVADFMIALKSYNRVSEVSVGGISRSQSSDQDAKKMVTFSVTAKINVKKDLTADDNTDVFEESYDSSSLDSNIDLTDEPPDLN